MSNKTTCTVKGCDTPRMDGHCRCEAHQREQWRVLGERKRTRTPLTDEQREARSAYQRQRQANLTPEQREAQRAYQRNYEASRKGVKTSTKTQGRKPIQNDAISQPDAILADFPRLLAIDANTGKYIQYAPVRVIEATSQRSLGGVRQLLSERADWIVVEDGGDND